MSQVFNFKSIKRKLDRMEQKAEFEVKNPEPGPAIWPYGIATSGAVPFPFEAPDQDPA